jgi:hypothetical protein
MPPAQAAISAEFVSRLAERTQETERLRRLPAATITDLIESNFTELLVPARYGGAQADFPAILDPVRRMAHGCASSAWTLGFYALHNWMLALFDERAQEEAFATRPFLAPAPLAPTGRASAWENASLPTRASRRRTKPIARAHLAEALVRPRACAGCSPTPLPVSKSSSHQTIRCRGRFGPMRGWPRRTSCTSPGR